jgi:hypothetical protein
MVGNPEVIRPQRNKFSPVKLAYRQKITNEMRVCRDQFGHLQLLFSLDSPPPLWYSDY